MNYGQKGQLSDDPQFFTAGVGDIPADQNVYESENNLDLTNNQASWTPDHSSRNLGNKAIFSLESSAINEDIVEPEPPEIVDIVTSSNAIVPESHISISPQTSFDPKLIRTDGDHINKAAIVEVNNVISEFSQTGNAADFYATVRGDDAHPGMVRSNLKNSYNREVA